MNSLIKSLAIFALLGTSASAQDVAYATNAEVEIEKLSKLEVYKLSNPGSSTFSALGVKPGKRKFNDKWQYFAFPITVYGKAKGGKIPAFVPELSVTIHVLFKKQGNDEHQVKLSKTIKYVDIPLDPEAKMGKSDKIYVGAFISPANAFKIAGSKKGSDKGSLSKEIEAIAYEVKFEDENCIKPGSERSFTFSGGRAEGKWWNNPRHKTNDAVLHSISETPFAASYASIFPAVAPMYDSSGASAGADSSASGSDADSE